MTLVQQVRSWLRISGFTDKVFEAFMLYDFDMLRSLAVGEFGSQRVRGRSNRDVLRMIAPRIPAGICGTVAHQLAEIFLGKKVGAEIKKVLNGLGPMKDGDLRTGLVAGKPGCWGCGAAAVKKSISGHFVLSDVFYLINLGTAHRFVALKQGSSVEVMQTWYDEKGHFGYSLSDWLALNNDRISRSASQFVADLEKMSQGDTGKSESLFQPVAGPYLLERHLKLSGHTLTFAAVQISAKEMAKNLLTHYTNKLGFLA